MIKNWKETTLDDVVELIIDHRGLTPKKLGGDWSSVGYRAISAKTIKNGRLVNEDQMNLLSEDLYKKWMKNEVRYGDIFLTSEAPLGEHIIWKTKERVVLSQRVFGIRTKKDILDPFFFNYFIDSRYFQHELKSRESGSTVTGIKQSELLKTKISFPSIKKQKQIAAVLSSFDDKIELLRKENETLEKIAQTIFKEWFGAYKIGDDLPNGWREGILGEEFEVKIGRTPPRKEEKWFSKKPTGKKWISIKDIKNSGVFIFNTTEYLTDKAVERFRIPIIEGGTTILSFKMTVGELAITTEKMISNEAIAQMKYLSGNLSSEFIYLYLKNLDFNSLGSTSSIVTAINSRMIKDLKIIVPKKEILIRFDEKMKPIFGKIRNNSKQIQTLSRLRDTLLPKLMSGEIRT